MARRISWLRSHAPRGRHVLRSVASQEPRGERRGLGPLGSPNGVGVDRRKDAGAEKVRSCGQLGKESWGIYGAQDSGMDGS